MYLRAVPVRDHHYWMIARAHRTVNRSREDRILYLGRLDLLTPERRVDLERKVLALHDDKVLHAFYAKLAEYGHPVPRPAHPGLVEEGPFPLPAVDFATLTDALRQDDLTGRDLAALVSRIGLPLLPERLEALSVRVEGGKKTRSISLYYRATSNPRPRSARPATDPSRPRRRSDAGSKPSGTP